MRGQLRLGLGSRRSLGGKGYGEGGKTEDSKNSAHKSSLDQTTKNSTPLDPGEGQMVPAKENIRRCPLSVNGASQKSCAIRLKQFEKSAHRQKPVLSPGPSHLKFDPYEGCDFRVSKLRGETCGIPRLGFALCLSFVRPCKLVMLLNLQWLTDFCFWPKRRKLAKQ
jgi:hypothetical protein